MLESLLFLVFLACFIFMLMIEAAKQRRGTITLCGYHAGSYNNRAKVVIQGKNCEMCKNDHA